MGFQQLLTEAVKYFTIHGYSNPHAMQDWMMRLRDAAESDMVPLALVDKRIQRSLGAVFMRGTRPERVKREHPGVPSFTPQMLPFSLKDELNKRILISSDLIRLNRDAAVEKTLQRFAGWATSVPEGGSKVVDKAEVKETIGKSLAQLKYEERRLLTDQGHKLMASINDVIAMDNDAIAAIWHDRGAEDHAYDARPDHLARSGKVYAIRSSWAHKEGLIDKGAGYTDAMTAPGEEVYCSCSYEYLYNVDDLPTDMLTAKGRKWLETKEP